MSEDRQTQSQKTREKALMPNTAPDSSSGCVVILLSVLPTFDYSFPFPLALNKCLN